MANIADIRQSHKVLLMMDKERELKYTLDSFGLLEDKYGSVDAAFDALGEQKIRDTIYFIWAGLIHEDEALTVEQVGRLIPFSKMGILMEKITEAMEADMPQKEAEATTENNPNQ